MKHSANHKNAPIFSYPECDMRNGVFIPATVYTDKQIQDQMIYLKALEASIQSMTWLVNFAYL